MAHRLFVYGSLQPGGPNAHVLAPLGGQWEAGSVRGHLIKEGWGAELGYPGLRLDDGGDLVQGQVLTTNSLAEFWEELDSFEGEGYQRQLTRVHLANGESVEAFIYTLS